MKKIYRIKILKIIQTLFFNLSVGFVSSFLILGNFLLLIPQIFPIVLLILILYTVISCYGNEITVKRSKISYFNFGGEEKVLDIIKNDVRVVESVENRFKSLKIKVNRYLKFTENGENHLKNISWITLKEGNELKVYIWKYKYFFERKIGKYKNNTLKEKKFMIPTEKLAILKEVDVKTKFFVISIFIFIILMTFSEKETAKFVTQLIYLIIIETFLLIFYFAQYSNVKDKIQKKLPKNITIDNLKIMIDEKIFYKSDIKKITMTGLKITERSYLNILNVPKVLIIENNARNQKFVIAPIGINVKWKYTEYISLFKNIRNWCFENRIEFVITGY